MSDRRDHEPGGEIRAEQWSEHVPRVDRGLRVGGKGFPERQGGKRRQKPVIVDAVHEDVDELLDVANNAMPGLDRAHCFKRGKRSQDAASMRGDLIAYEVNGLVAPDHTLMLHFQIGRASCRERVCKYV